MPPPPPPPPPPPVIYPTYGYATYTSDYGYHHQSMYNPHSQTQYYHQVYGTSPSTIGSSFYYGYALQPSASRGPTFAGPSQSQSHRIQGPPYLHYPTQGDRSFAGNFPPPPPPPQLQLPPRPTLPVSSSSTSETQTTQQASQTSSATGVEASSLESPNT
uniref:Uncharacterized protein n=1 Tax=Nelumbo nucifera TaxID=4432 RepID=A0A822ZCB0_NELNU|nr:TPA_asm: hypothetical protein HUJ06_015418 [Nelumbo nucifera]